MSRDVLCVGEILWDALPAGLFLGGAPFNVACHLTALGESVSFASRVGDDRLGAETLRRLPVLGVEPDLVQQDESLPTGFVEVSLDETGEPEYEIIEPVAWDALALTPEWRQQAEESEALVFGSLSQRSATSRQTIQRLCQDGVTKVFDVNLRPPFDHRDIVETSLCTADVVKMNGTELRRMTEWFDLSSPSKSALADLADSFDCSVVCVTKGKEGAWLWQDEQFSRHPGYAVAVEDTVGAGDAFLAAFLSGLLAGRAGEGLLDLANRLGAYVATHSGALPSYEVDTLDDIADLPLQGVPRTEER